MLRVGEWGEERESRTLFSPPRDLYRYAVSIPGGEDIRMDGITILPSVTGLQRRVHSLLRSPLCATVHLAR